MAIKESSEIEENVVLDETAAADTLKPGAGSVAGDVGKTELMASVVAAMGGMSKEEINKFQAVLAQYGKNKTPGGVAMNAAANKASTLIEAAVNARVGLEVARIEEEFEEAVQEVAERVEEELAGKIDTYMDYVAEQWFDDNKIAIESSLKVEAADKFIDGVKALFAEHMVEVPEETVDMVESLEARVAELEGQLNEEINEKIELTKLVEEAEKEAIFDEVAEGLAATQVEKLRTLAEGLEYSDADAYRRKVELVKENYFTEKKATASSLVVEETTVGSLEELTEQTNVVVEAGMQQYVSAIGRTTKK